jgi:hypothetical protein
MSGARIPTAALVAAAALGVAAPGAAHAAKHKHPAPRIAEADYTVVARATMDESWNYDEQERDLCLDGCTVETKGSGTAHVDLKSTPTHWLVMRGAGGRPPAIDVGTGEGAPTVGGYRRTGDLAITHGGQWAAANPPQTSPNTGCGSKTTKFAFSLAFTGKTEIAPVGAPLLDREDCPDGPTSHLAWADDVPSLAAVKTTTSPTRFLSLKSFTVRGTKTWKTDAEPSDSANVTRSGTKTVTWSWSVTFTMNKTKHR